MKIGLDYDKIEWNFMGLDLLEPNAFFGDLILGLACIAIGLYLLKGKENSKFTHYWKLFFFTMGAGFIMGGLGHLLWNYWGVHGKYFAWYSGIFGTLFAEQAMISINPNSRERSVFNTVVRLKFVYGILILSFLIITQDLTNNLERGLSVSMISTGLGTLFAFGYLPYYYRKQLNLRLRHFWISLLILIPIGYVQAQKFNPAQWFDRNDVSHILILLSLTLYFFGIIRYRSRLTELTQRN